MFSLGNPAALLLLLLPLLIIAVLILARFLFKKGVRLSSLNGYNPGLSMRVVGYYISLAVIVAGLGIIAFSVTNPMKGIVNEKSSTEGIDILISLDISYSMLTPDYVGSTRIDMAKKIIKEFIKQRQGDRIGLVTFSVYSSIKSPATSHYELLYNIIDNIVINPKKNVSTSIGLGLASAVNRLVSIQDNESKSKVIILVTDGMNNSGNISPGAATQLAVDSSIKVYTIGIGTSEEVDLKLLQDISDKTGGKFYHSQNSGDLNVAFSDIDKIEKRKLDVVKFSSFQYYGYYISVIGIIVFMIGLISHLTFFRRIG